MNPTRRDVIRGFGILSVAAVTPVSVRATGADSASEPMAPKAGTIALPDKASFDFEGTHLNAAYTHPLGARTREALEAYIGSRVADAARNWPRENARDEAVQLFARLIGAQPTEVAVVPSTLEGENLIAASLSLGPGAGVVTDPFHYDASLIMYGELHKRGMPLVVVAPRGNRIDYADLGAAIGRETRLVAISLVASNTGYRHDLKTICDIAHGKGALVYADIIQAVGAVPLDVKASGVDFCCAGMYKWLMGEFGAAFLYVRPDRLAELKRVQVGWRPIVTYKPHYPPLDSPDPLTGDYELGTTTAQVFEVSTPDWSGLAAAVGALSYLHEIDVERIVRHREPLLQRLQDELPKHGFMPLTPADSHGAHLVYWREGAGKRFYQALKDNRIFVTLSRNRIRVSVSVYNDMEDIERLMRVLAS
jgi:selenocysteine lyase/cysteine desulfurase